MAASGERRARRGPAPIASFDHDVSDESSPETKQTFQLPEIREDAAPTPAVTAAGLAPAEPRARSHSTPGLGAPATPRIDISRASSSSHHDSRDSSPELALFAGTEGGAARLELGFREDGALELRSSTEELAFLEPTPPTPAPPPPPTGPAPRRHSRKDSQGSEAALLGVSGRTSRLSSVGSQCSAQSALSGLSHVSRLSVVSGVSRSPSPHKMLLETSFCGPKPIETDPEICGAAVEERLLEIAKLNAPVPPTVTVETSAPAAGDARDRREVRTEVMVERARPAPRATPAAPIAAVTAAEPPPAVAVTPADEKRQKESRNKARVEERRARPRERRDQSEPEVYKSRNRSKDIIRIKLKPDDESDDEDDDDESSRTLTADTQRAARPTALVRPAPAPSPTPSRRSPSPAGAPVSRKSSFCSLFKSRETIASPDSPSEALRRKKSLNEGRSRSKSRDRSATPSSAGKIRGSVLSLFKTPRRSAASTSPGSRAASPVVQPAPAPATISCGAPANRDPLKYYEATQDGVIHIPLRTPPDGDARRPIGCQVPPTCADHRPASAPAAPPVRRTVLPDGSIIIPLHSPTEKTVPDVTIATVEPSPAREETRHCVAAVVEPPLPTSPMAQMMSTPVETQPPESSPEEAREATEVTPGEATRPGTTKRRLVFTTHVGSTEQVFSTQFSLTKTPSVTSEISSSFASFPEDLRPPALRDTHITTSEPEVSPPEAASGGVEEVREVVTESTEEFTVEAGTPHSTRDSSSSEPSSEARQPQGTDAEQRGLVVQESFDEELPYVPTTLPLERSLALPMVPVRERGTLHHSIARVERPRGATPTGRVPRAPPPVPPPAPPTSADKLRIRLPRRARTASNVSTGAGAAPTTTTAERSRTRSGSDAVSGEPRPKPDWIDFEEVPERRKQPRRIQTLPAPAPRDQPAAATVLLSYVEPDECRCECHGHAAPAPDPPTPHPHNDDELPLLHEHVTSPGGQEVGSRARPFTADLDLRHDHQHAHTEGRH